MKKLILSAVTLLLILTANAQFTQGDKYLSGSVSFNLNKTETSTGIDQKQLFIGFSPSFTKFKTTKKAAGFRLFASYGRSTFVNQFNTSEIHQQGIGLGVFSQNYLLLGKGFYLLAEKGIKLNYLLSKTLPDNRSTEYSATLYVTPGIGYKLSNRLLINLEFNDLINVSFTHQKNVNNNSSTPVVSHGNYFSFFSGLNNGSLGNLGINFGWKLN